METLKYLVIIRTLLHIENENGVPVRHTMNHLAFFDSIDDYICKAEHLLDFTGYKGMDNTQDIFAEAIWQGDVMTEDE